MKIRQLRHPGWIALALTSCGHIGLDWDTRPGAALPGDGDGDAWGGEVGSLPDGSGDGDATGGDLTGDGDSSSGGFGGEVPDQGAGGTSSVGGATAAGGSSDGGGDNASGGVEGVATGGVDGSGGEDAAGGTDAGGTGGAGTGGAPQSVACAAPGDHHFGFDSSASFSQNGPGAGVWGIDTSYTMNSGSLSWSSEEGQFALGSLEALVVRPAITNNRQVLYPRTVLSRRDLRGGHLTAHVYLQSGLDAIAKIFIQSDGYLWAEGPLKELTLGAWTCLELEVDEPAYAEEDFDPSKIIGIGVEIARDESSELINPITAYVDDVSY